MRISRFALSAAILVAACSTTDSTNPNGQLKATDKASFNVGPNDKPAGNWNCSGKSPVVQSCLASVVTGDTTTSKVLNLQIASINQIVSSVGSSANYSCSATSGGQLYTDRTSGRITNGQPSQSCSIDTPQNVQTVIIYPNPYPIPVKKDK